MSEKLRVLILGVTGMLGSTLFRFFSESEDYITYGTVRNRKKLDLVLDITNKNIISGVDALDMDSIINAFNVAKLDIVINCIGIIKQLDAAKDHLISISINSLFPHKLANICAATNSRLIHISTDCVFDGKKGSYKDNDPSDADDLYGKTKYLGELKYDHCVTIRTSIIGHEISTKLGLVEWFLSLDDKVNGFNKAIFSGFPTIEIANIIHQFIIPNEHISGIYNVSSNKISKYNLLRLIADRYGKKIEIEIDNKVEIDRSLDSNKFQEITGYKPPEWKELVDKMYLYQNKT